MKREFLFTSTTILLVLIFDYAELYVTIKTFCTTPEGRTGQCIPKEECQPLTDFIAASKPLSERVERTLKDYACGYKRDPSKVCCPSGPINVTEEVPPPPPDVTQHRNLQLLPEECGLIDIGDKIRNGENALFNEFPWMALLSYNTTRGPEFKCGGTIINDRYILTAAHCVVNVSLPLIGIRVGEYDVANKIDCADEETCLPPVQDLTIEKVIYPEDYNITLHANDIALIRVSKIDLDADNAKPVCLPIIEEIRNWNYSKGVVAGWGFTDPFGTTPSILQKVLLDKRDTSICQTAYNLAASIKINYKQMCVGGIAKKDSCRGDSGGPFHVATHFNDDDRYVEFGIVSIGPVYCGYEGVPGVYTKVTYYMDWILDNLEP